VIVPHRDGAEDRGDVDDPRIAGHPQQMLQGLGQEHGAEDVGVEDGVEILSRDLFLA
jgi:hypothetical protein